MTAVIALSKRPRGAGHIFAQATRCNLLRLATTAEPYSDFWSRRHDHSKSAAYCFVSSLPCRFSRASSLRFLNFSCCSGVSTA